MSAAVLDDHIRQIRNIQIGHQDLEPLLPNKRFYAGEVLDIYNIRKMFVVLIYLKRT